MLNEHLAHDSLYFYVYSRNLYGIVALLTVQVWRQAAAAAIKPAAEGAAPPDNSTPPVIIRQCCSCCYHASSSQQVPHIHHRLVGALTTC